LSNRQWYDTQQNQSQTGQTAKITPVQKGILTTTMAAQGDTEANCSATDTIDIIHNYVEF
jgi:hypothetical protein